MIPIVDFQKIKSPFKRVSNEKGHYVCTPEIEEGFEWIFQDGVRAVDKLHGTNICLNIQGGMIECIDNRKTRVVNSCEIPIKSHSSRFLLGVLNACEKGWITFDGRYYGELIGPSINGNIHAVDHHLFVPFEYLREKCHWHCWVQNKYPKDFETISEWFKNLPSLFTQRHLKKEVMAEGLIFYAPDGRMAKLRRDMFDWYEGDRHND